MCDLFSVKVSTVLSQLMRFIPTHIVERGDIKETFDRLSEDKNSIRSQQTLQEG